MVVSDRAGWNCFCDSLDCDSWADFAADRGSCEFWISRFRKAGPCCAEQFREASELLGRAAARRGRRIRGAGIAFGLDSGVQKSDAASRSFWPDRPALGVVHSCGGFVAAGLFNRVALQPA